MNRGRHEHICLGTGIAEHNSLIAGSFVFVSCCIDPLGDIARLLMKEIINCRVLPMKAVLFVSNFLDALAHAIFEMFDGHGVRTPHFACQHNSVGRA